MSGSGIQINDIDLKVKGVIKIIREIIYNEKVLKEKIQVINIKVLLLYVKWVEIKYQGMGRNKNVKKYSY